MRGRLLLLWSEVGYNFRYSWAIKLQSAHWETSACSSHSVRRVNDVLRWSKLWHLCPKPSLMHGFSRDPSNCLSVQIFADKSQFFVRSQSFVHTISKLVQHHWHVCSQSVHLGSTDGGIRSSHLPGNCGRGRESSALQLDHGHFAPRRPSHGRLVDTLWVVLQTINR